MYARRSLEVVLATSLPRLPQTAPGVFKEHKNPGRQEAAGWLTCQSPSVYFQLTLALKNTHCLIKGLCGRLMTLAAAGKSVECCVPSTGMRPLGSQSHGLSD